GVPCSNRFRRLRIFMKQGTLIFDMKGRLLYYNEDAADLFPPSRESGKNPRTPLKLPKEITSLVQQNSKDPPGQTNEKNGPDLAFITLGGTINLQLRCFPVGKFGSPEKKSHLVIIAETPGRELVFDFNGAGAKFQLSRREIEVLRLLCEGRSNKNIGQTLFICEQTVKDHVKHIMQKMGAHSRNQVMVKLLKGDDAAPLMA
ncbi:MAG: helix-turn-helix transcriptional regulator, partial [Syntrophales bacterium LBB04]|nr:helix-turn-helix transcriptional regulator [Syntrophales bacterium LBB04]